MRCNAPQTFFLRDKLRENNKMAKERLYKIVIEENPNSLVRVVVPQEGESDEEKRGTLQGHLESTSPDVFSMIRKSSYFPNQNRAEIIFGVRPEHDESDKWKLATYCESARLGYAITPINPEDRI